MTLDGASFADWEVLPEDVAAAFVEWLDGEGRDAFESVEKALAAWRTRGIDGLPSPLSPHARISDREMANLRRACLYGEPGDWDRAVNTVLFARGGRYPHDWYSRVIVGGMA